MGETHSEWRKRMVGDEIDRQQSSETDEEYPAWLAVGVTREQWLGRTKDELDGIYGRMGEWQLSSDPDIRPTGNILDHPAADTAPTEQLGLRMMGMLEEQAIEDLRRDAAKWNVRTQEEGDMEQTQVVGWGPGEEGMLRCGWCTRFKGQLHADDCQRPTGERLARIQSIAEQPSEEVPMTEPGDFSQHRPFAAPGDLPERVVVGANGAYWRDYGSYYSMCPVSEDNDPVVPIAVYVPEATTRGADRTDADIERSARVSELSMLLDFIEGDPIDGVPKRKQIEQAVKYRILGLMKDDPEPIDADPGREPIELPRIFPPGMADEDLIALTEKRVRLEIATKLAIWITEMVGD